MSAPLAAPFRTTTAPVLGPAPRWARWAAHAVVLATLPSSLWRVAMAAGLPVGYSPQVLREVYDAPGWGSVYMAGLSVLTECLALLTFVLVRQRGAEVPHRLPLVGGRSVPPRLVTASAAVGAVLLTLLALSQLVLLGLVDELGLAARDHLTGEAARFLWGLCYAPLVAWGPLLAAVTYSHHRRHRAARR